MDEAGGRHWESVLYLFYWVVVVSFPFLTATSKGISMLLYTGAIAGWLMPAILFFVPYRACVRRLFGAGTGRIPRVLTGLVAAAPAALLLLALGTIIQDRPVDFDREQAKDLYYSNAEAFDRMHDLLYDQWSGISMVSLEDGEVLLWQANPRNYSRRGSAQTLESFEGFGGREKELLRASLEAAAPRRMQVWVLPDVIELRGNNWTRAEYIRDEDGLWWLVYYPYVGRWEPNNPVSTPAEEPVPLMGERR